MSRRSRLAWARKMHRANDLATLAMLDAGEIEPWELDAKPELYLHLRVREHVPGVYFTADEWRAFLFESDPEQWSERVKEVMREVTW